SADAVAGSQSRVGGALAVSTGQGLVLAPADDERRWNPQALATALLGLAADAARDAQPVTVMVPLGDESPAGDATDLWGGGLAATRKALAPLTMRALVQGTRPLLGFHGMSAAVRAGRESDIALAQSAQDQEQRWSQIAREADALAGPPGLIGPTRLSDSPG